MKVSDFVDLFLQHKGVKQVFEMSGGMITHLLDSIHKGGVINIISMHHEQSAAFAADAVGRITKIPGVSMATSGPGATNLITGIGSAYFDSSPTVFIAGQVNRDEIKKDDSIRQLGFQETDIVSIVKPITKLAVQIKFPEEVPEILEKAFDIATKGRPGPVLVDIPMDVQKADISVGKIKKNEQKERPNKLVNDFQIKELIEKIKDAKKPMILAGGGINSSNSRDLFREFVKTIKVPVVSSLMGLDSLQYTDPFRVGFIGSYGNRWANLAISKADLLLVLGSRLDIRQTSSQVDQFKQNKTIYHIDCEIGEINNRVKGCVGINAELNSFLSQIIGNIKNNSNLLKKEWLTEINNLKKRYPDYSELSGITGINPNKFLHSLSKKSPLTSTYVTDVGQHQMWAAQSLEILENQNFVTCGGMGSMGFGLPAAIGASICNNKMPVVLIAGDGGFQSNIQELQTVVHHNLPIKIIILNNQCHGMVRQFQEDYFEKRYQSTLWGYSTPDFEKIASAYGIKTKTIKTEKEIDNSVDWLWEDINTPSILQVQIDTFTNAVPKIAFGKANFEMYPNKDL
jgi:acetolactate synthase I/II/III large subunit